jgi:hypothetical protein
MKMLKRKLFFSVGGLISLVMLIGIVSCTPAEIQALQGTLQNVDSISGNVTVKLNDGTTNTFNFNDVKIETIRQSLGGATLEIGDQVTVRIRTNGHIEEVDAHYAEAGGVINSLGTGNVTFTSKKGDITLNVTPDTKIRIEDKGNATSVDLKVGQKIEAKYDVSTNNDGKHDGAEISGTIKTIDKANQTFTITNQKRGDVILNVTSGTVIRNEDKGTAAFIDLKTGQKIEATYDLNTKNAIKLTVETD